MLHAAEPDLNRKPQSCTKREDPSRRLQQTCEPLPHLSLITSPITRAPLYPTLLFNLTPSLPVCPSALSHIFLVSMFVIPPSCGRSPSSSFSQGQQPAYHVLLPCPPSSALKEFNLTEAQVAAECKRIKAGEKKESVFGDPEADDPALADIRAHTQALFSVDKKVTAIERDANAGAIEGTEKIDVTGDCRQMISTLENRAKALDTLRETCFSDESKHEQQLLVDRVKQLIKRLKRAEQTAREAA